MMLKVTWRKSQILNSKYQKPFITNIRIVSIRFSFHRAWYCTQWSGVVRINPLKLSLNSLIGAPGGELTLNVWKKADVNKKSIFRANVSPAQSRFPALNGNDMSFFSDKLPSQSKNRSGLNFCGSSHTDSSWFAELSAATTTVSWKKWFVFNVLIRKISEKMRERRMRVQWSVSYFWNVVSQKLGVFQGFMCEPVWHQGFISHNFA